MHVETPRGLGDVPVAHFIDALNMFPAHAIGRHRVFGRRDPFTACTRQSGVDVVCIGGF